MKKIILCLSIFSIFLWLNTTFSNDEPRSFNTENLYKLYIERTEKECKIFKKTDNNNERIINFKESNYFTDLSKKRIEIWRDLPKAKKEFEKNMDEIFECATLSTYQRKLEMIKSKLINKNPKLNAKLKSKIEQKLNELKSKMKSLEWKCSIKKWKDSLVKLAVLNQATYETCKYTFYLDYLKEYNNNVKNLIDSQNQDVSIKEFNVKYSEKMAEIDAEREKVYRALPIAIQAYNDFENNIWSHILLELLKEDYEVFRLWLHKTLNPLNQVIYKISNAMRQ